MQGAGNEVTGRAAEIVRRDVSERSFLGATPGDVWPVARLMGKGLSAMLAIAEWFAQRSPLDAVGIVPPGAVITLTIALAISALSTTWLCLAAVPLLCVGLIWIGGRQTPDVLVSEDARLVAMRLADENVAVNRSRPSSFTMQNWQRALQVANIVKPKNQPLPKSEADGTLDTGFSCQSGLCLALHRSGAVVAHANSAESAKPACDTADLIVVDDATVEDLCAGKPVAVITKRDLARQGSAEIFLRPDTAPAIDYAISEPYRPWHSQRQFSREARGLPPHRRLGQTSEQPKTIDLQFIVATTESRVATARAIGVLYCPGRKGKISSAGSARPACRAR